MSMPDLVSDIAAVVAGAEEPDDAIRAAVLRLVGDPRVTWAEVAFVEDGELVAGPAAGDIGASTVLTSRIDWQGDPVGELRVAGDLPPGELTAIAAVLSAPVLLGWDTGGEPWEP